MMNTTIRTMTVGLMILTLTALNGCGHDSPKTEQPKPGQIAKVEVKKVDDHSHWWCAEHGIPEDECSMCSAKVAKTCKANGDWCEKHDRAMSQCFICDPSLKDKFAVKYRTKYGKEPPPIEVETDEKK